MKTMRNQYTTAELCEAFEVSSSGYYRWLKSKPTPRQKENQSIVEKIQLIHGDEQTRCYGSPRMTRELNALGYSCSENRVARLMAAEGVQAEYKRPFRPKTTQSDPHALPAPNLLAKAPSPTSPGEALVSDITYVSTNEGWLYLAVVVDLFSRAVIGWQLGGSLHTDLVLGAFEQSRRRLGSLKGGLFHSDRGCQYTSKAFRKRLSQSGLRQSMSAKGYCYDNAYAESFFATLKREAFPQRGLFASKREARMAIFKYLETFYNRRRRHSSLDYQAPDQVLLKYFQTHQPELN